MPPLVSKFLSVLYTDQTLQDRWKSVIDNFYVSNGVKQRGILSPDLFAVYIDGLFKNLKNKSASGLLVAVWEINLWVVCYLLIKSY